MHTACAGGGVGARVILSTTGPNVPPTLVSIVATPDAMASPVTGLFETLKSAGSFVAGEEPFEVQIVAETAGPVVAASGLGLTAHCSVDEVTATDVVIVPSMTMGDDGGSAQGRYPR